MDAKENAAVKAAEGEKTPMSLADLGLEEEQTPAEKSEAQAKEEHKTIARKDGVKIEQISALDPKDAEEHPQMKVPRPENTKLVSHDMQTQHLKGDTRPSISIKGNQPAKHEYQEGHIIPAHAAGAFAKEQAALDPAKQGEATVNMEGLTRGDDNNPKVESEGYTIVSNVNDIAKNPTSDKTVIPPIQRTLNHLHDLADKGIQRTENEMMAAGGRIDEAKEKYVEARYKTLMERSKQSPNLKKKIDFYLKAMETDPGFDGATDYMKKGYILFKVANDTSIGITDKSFGLAQESIKGRRNSAETAQTIQATVEGSDNRFDNENQVVLGNADDYRNNIPVKSSDEVASESSDSDTVGTVLQPEESAFDDVDKEGDEGLYANQVKDNIPIRTTENVLASESTSTVSTSQDEQVIQAPKSVVTISSSSVGKAVLDAPSDDVVDDTDDVRVEVVSSELERGLIEPDIPVDDIMVEEMNNEAKRVESEIERMYGVSDEDYRKMEIDYLRQAAKLLHIDGNSESLMNIGEGGAVNLNTAFKIFMQQDQVSRSPRHLKATWPLMFTGMPAEMTAFSGQELTQFIDDLQAGFVPTEQNPNPQPSMVQLRSVFSALYRHFVNPGRPNFDTWLHQISSSDFYDLIFAQYNAQFHSNNYLAYQCTKRGCAKLFLEKKDIMDMVRFPDNDKDSKVRDRFNAIMKKDSVMTNLYRTNPVPINQYFAMSFITPSIYSMSFEPASLSLNFKKTYESIIGFLPMLDAVWIIDHRNGGKKHRIDFGIIPSDMERTVMRKVKGLTKIMSTFNVDQRSIIYGEYLKVVRNMQKEEITYQIPSTKCPVCGTEIPAEVTDPIGALFIRARLSIEAASTPVLL